MRAKRINRQLREKTNRRKTNMKKIFAIALALMLAIGFGSAIYLFGA